MKMRRCEDEKMRRCEDVKMRRCEVEKIKYRPPLLEEPCAQTLSGKKPLGMVIYPEVVVRIMGFYRF